MKNNKLKIWLLSCLTILLAFILAVWPAFRTAAQKKDKPASSSQQGKNSNSHHKSAANPTGGQMSDIDSQTIHQALLEIDRAMEKLKTEEWPRVQVELARAMEQLDTEKIAREITNAVNQVDIQKINLAVTKAMTEVNASKICEEVKAAMAQIDMSELQKELAAKKINSEELALQMEKLKMDMKDLHIDIRKEMENASREMEKAKVKLQLMSEGLKALENEGLIKKGDKISIEYKEGIMYINGRAQTKEVSDKYKKYFGEEHSSIHIDNDDNMDTKLAK